MMKKSVGMLLVLLVLLVLPVCCLAAAISDLRVSPGDVKSINDVRSISWYTQTDGGNERYIFLPGEANPKNLRIWFKGPSTINIGNKSYKSGDRLSVTPGRSYTFTNGARQFKVYVLQAGKQGSIYMTTESGTLTAIDKSREHLETGTVRVFSADGEEYTNQKMEEIRIRGNGSATFVKKSYQFKLSKKANLFGMGKAKTWLLISNYKDWTNLRNKLVYEMADYVGLAYTPETCFVNLYVNHQYRGLYLMAEKLQVSKNRVDLDDLEAATQAVNTKPLSSYPIVSQTRFASPGKGRWHNIPKNPEDITGGYLMKIDLVKRYTKYDDEPSYATTRKIAFFFKEPKYMSKAQYNYITKLIQSFEDAIFASNGKDPKTKKSYQEIADFDSLVLKYMVEEVSANFDGSKCSQYFYKPADSQSTKLYAGPVWDYDSTWGAYIVRGTNSTKLATSLFVAEADHYAWWAALYRRPEFVKAVKQQWKEKFSHAMKILLGSETDPTGKLHSIDSLAAELSGSNAMDFAKWPYRKLKSNKAYGATTYQANLTFLKKMVRTRYNFLVKTWK